MESDQRGVHRTATACVIVVLAAENRSTDPEPTDAFVRDGLDLAIVEPTQVADHARGRKTMCLSVHDVLEARIEFQ